MNSEFSIWWRYPYLLGIAIVAFFLVATSVGLWWVEKVSFQASVGKLDSQLNGHENVPSSHFISALSGQQLSHKLLQTLMPVGVLLDSSIDEQKVFLRMHLPPQNWSALRRLPIWPGWHLQTMQLQKLDQKWQWSGLWQRAPLPTFEQISQPRGRTNAHLRRMSLEPVWVLPSENEPVTGVTFNQSLPLVLAEAAPGLGSSSSRSQLTLQYRGWMKVAGQDRAWLWRPSSPARATQLVAEGDSVGPWEVLQIRSDYLLLGQGSRRWRLLRCGSLPLNQPDCKEP